MVTVRRSLTIATILMIGAAQALAAPNSRSVVVEGQVVPYDTAVDHTVIHAPDGHSVGTIVSFAYLKVGSGHPVADRPVVFAFNGGPGSASVPLHSAMLAPLRIDLPADPAAPVAARYPLVTNGDTILGDADLVLVDPPGTGLSRVADPSAKSWLRSVDGDADAVAEMIQSWLAKHGRMASPVYILGESYGAERAVPVARRLAPGVRLDGIVLISQSLQIIDTVQRQTNIVGQAAGLPTLAASAWYHRRAGAGEQLAPFVSRAWDFARKEYLPALFAGSMLDPDEMLRVSARLAEFTGIPAADFLRSDLYMSKEQFRRRLLADRGLILGLYDTRYTGPLDVGSDPSDAAIRPMAPATIDILRREFGITADGYVAFDPTMDPDWQYLRGPLVPTDGATFKQLEYGLELAALMLGRPQLRVMVAGSYYDTAASWGGDTYLASHYGLTAARLTVRRYMAGHVFYTDAASRHAFARDLATFVAAHRSAPASPETRP